MKELYLAIVARLKLRVPELKHIKLYNDQFRKSNNDNPQGNVEPAFPYPCAFISFNEPEFKQLGYGYQKGDILLTIYIGRESIVYEDLAVLDLKQRVYQGLHRFRPEKCTSFQRVAERPDYEHNNVMIYEIDFKFCYTDQSAFTQQDYIEVNDVEIDVNPDSVDHITVT